MFKSFVLSLAFFSVLNVLAHQQFTISGTVTDAQTNKPIEQCNLRISGTFYSATTDGKGRYTIQLKNEIGPFTVEASHVSYEQEVRPGLKFSNGQLTVDFRLMPNIDSTIEVVISTAPDTVWGSAELNVADFAFIDNRLLLLTYEREERWKRQEDSKTTLYSNCKLVLLDSNNTEMSRTSVNGLAIGFYLNYLNEVFLQCKNQVYLVERNDDSLDIQTFSTDDFHQYIEPVVDTLGGIVYYSNYNANYPAFDYMSFNQNDSTYHTLRYLVDEELMQRFRAQYRDLGPREKLEAFRMQVETGIDKEVVSAYMTGFPSTPFYQPLNIPMIIVGDTLLLFDHVHDKLYRYNNLNEPLDSALINYHKSQKNVRWGETVVKDDLTNCIYTWHEKAGTTYLKKIDTNSGAAVHVCKLSNKYTDKIKVHNNAAYYIYRPFESSQNRFLYREKIGG